VPWKNEIQSAIPNYKELAWKKDKQAIKSTPLYTAPPKREWSGLSVSKAEDLLGEFENDPFEMLFALDKYLREKNT